MDKENFYYKGKNLGNCSDKVSDDILDSITNAIAGINYNYYKSKPDKVFVNDDYRKRVKENSPKNVIHRPEHYSKNGLTPVEAFEAGLFSVDETRGFLKGNIIKYIVRYNDKGYLEDLFKAKEYLNLLISFEYKIYEQKISKESL